MLLIDPPVSLANIICVASTPKWVDSLEGKSDLVVTILILQARVENQESQKSSVNERNTPPTTFNICWKNSANGVGM